MPPTFFLNFQHKIQSSAHVPPPPNNIILQTPQISEQKHGSATIIRGIFAGMVVPDHQAAAHAGNRVDLLSQDLAVLQPDGQFVNPKIAADDFEKRVGPDRVVVDDQSRQVGQMGADLPDAPIVHLVNRKFFQVLGVLGDDDSSFLRGGVLGEGQLLEIRVCLDNFLNASVCDLAVYKRQTCDFWENLAKLAYMSILEVAQLKPQVSDRIQKLCLTQLTEKLPPLV